MQQKRILIVDQIGRNIAGTVVDETDTTVTLHNPTIVHFQPTQGGQLELQLFPLFFFELVDKDARDSMAWTYNKSAIAISNVKLAENIVSKLDEINRPKVEASPKVISIEDI